MMILPLSTWTMLDAVRNTAISGKLGAIMSTSAVLAAMMAAAMVLNVASEYIQGHGAGIWQLVRPLVLLAFVCQFNTFVLNPLNSLVNVFTRDIAASCEVSTKEYTSQWAHNTAMITALTLQTNENNFSAELDKIADSDSSVVGKFFAKIWSAIKKIFKDLFSSASFTIIGLVGGILFLIVKILLFAQQVLCSVYLTIAGLIGPIVFALAIVNGYSSGIKNWIARYIQIAMWIPIGYIILYLNLQISNAFCNQACAEGATLSLEWFMVALQIVALVSIASVPKIAAWVIESTGANDAHSSMSQPMRTIARKLIKF